MSDFNNNNPGEELYNHNNIDNTMENYVQQSNIPQTLESFQSINEYAMQDNYGYEYNSSSLEYDNAEVNYTIPESEIHQTEKKSIKDFGYYVKKTLLIAVTGLLFGVFAGIAFNVVVDYKQTKDKNDNAKSDTTEAFIVEDEHSMDEFEATTIETVATLDNSSGMDVSDIAEAVMPSTVSITVTSIEEYGYWGQSYEYEAEGSGSGIIIGENDTELLIVTNNHVVSGADSVTVTFIDETVYEAKVKGTNVDNDLAIIVVDLKDLSNETKSAIKAAKLGDSNKLKVGEQVVAIGNSLGYGQSVTTGIVSALDRMNDTNVTPLIQTDAAINPGNSGGALLNMNGEVIGINSSKFASTEVEGMGYAIPITQVENIITELMSRETREKVDEDKVGYLGVGCQDVDPQTVYFYNIEGALVTEVYEGTPAYKAGIKPNQIIVGLDGQSVTSASDLVEKLQYYSFGEKVDVVVACFDGDEYKEKTIKIRLARRPRD